MISEEYSATIGNKQKLNRPIRKACMNVPM